MFSPHQAIVKFQVNLSLSSGALYWVGPEVHFGFSLRSYGKVHFYKMKMNELLATSAFSVTFNFLQPHRL